MLIDYEYVYARDGVAKDSFVNFSVKHDDVIKWRRFPHYWPGDRRLSKSSRHRGFETPWRLLWRHCNEIFLITKCLFDQKMFRFTGVAAASLWQHLSLGNQCMYVFWEFWEFEIKAERKGEDWFRTPTPTLFRLYWIPAAHDAMKTSLWGQNDVVTSFWRHNNVIITSRPSWGNTIVLHGVVVFLLFDTVKSRAHYDVTVMQSAN